MSCDAAKAVPVWKANTVPTSSEGNRLTEHIGVGKGGGGRGRNGVCSMAVDPHNQVCTMRPRSA